MPTYTGLDQLAETERRRLLRYVPLEPDEKLLLYHGTALLFGGNSGTVLTNRRLISYKKSAVTAVPIGDMVVTYDDRALWLDRGSPTQPVRVAFMDFSGAPGWILETYHRLDGVMVAPDAWISAARDGVKQVVASTSFGLAALASEHAGVSRALRQLLRTAARRAIASGNAAEASAREAELREVAVHDALRAARQCALAFVLESDSADSTEARASGESYLAGEQLGVEVIERLPWTAANRLVTARLLPDPGSACPIAPLTRIEVLVSEASAPGFAARLAASGAPIDPVGAFWLDWAAQEESPDATLTAMESAVETRPLAALSRLVHRGSSAEYLSGVVDSDLATLLGADSAPVLAAAALLPVSGIRSTERVTEELERALWDKAMCGDDDVKLVARLIRAVRVCSTAPVAQPEYSEAVKALGELAREARERLGL